MAYGRFSTRMKFAAKKMVTSTAALSAACLLSASVTSVAFADTTEAVAGAAEPGSQIVETVEPEAQSAGAAEAGLQATESGETEPQPAGATEQETQPDEAAETAEAETESQPAKASEAEPEAAETAAPKPQLIEGTTISVMGDSISTYAGWSDSNPIADESSEYRYGEAYYGPAGEDYHNTDLLVTDTWWHQAAEELGGEILVSNAGNSTGLLYASYPYNEEWQQYLQDLLMYKSRASYLDTEEADPDIIALYIGSNDVAKVSAGRFGSIDEVDFETLITENADGSFSYAEPSTVAEAYCILLHKISVEYPSAETYCFTVLPNSGGDLDTCNKRLQATYPFNEMVKGVAAHFGATVVDLFSAFGLDADGDGSATQEELDAFKTYFNGDPHPNAAGFDVITECFVSAVLANSSYVETASAEGIAGQTEGTAAAQVEGMTYVNNEAELTGDNGLIAQGIERVEVPEDPDIASGYEFEYVGSDKLSSYWAAELIADESQSYEGQGAVYSSEDGEVNLYSEHPIATLTKRGFLVPKLYLGLDEPVEGSYVAQYDSVQQFVLVDEAGNTVTTYCADLLTPAIDGYDYTVTDIENATYYGEENAAMIRTIALNGYWGSDPGEDEEPAFGSLAAVKKMMADSGEFTDDEISRLNDGMAMTATQYAIWTYSNSMDKRVFVNAYYTVKASLSRGNAAPEADVDLIFKLYRYLITLPPVSIQENTTSNTIIDGEGLLEDVSVSVTDKPMEHPANQDADDSNDVYTVDLSLALDVAVKAGNGDDLVLMVMNGDEVVAVGRIAGELGEGEQQLAFENGKYVIPGLTLQEGNTEGIRIVLSGTQNLSRGVYLFVSETREVTSGSGETELESSQSMVGVAEGAHGVHAATLLGLDLDIDDAAIALMNIDDEASAAEVADQADGSALPNAGDATSSDKSMAQMAGASQAGDVSSDVVDEALVDELINQMEDGEVLNVGDETSGAELMSQAEGASEAESANAPNASSKSTTLSGGKAPVIAQTGDSIGLGIWAASLIAGYAAMVAAIACRKRNIGRF